MKANLKQSRLKIFFVSLLILFNLALIVSYGMGDMGSWCYYAKAAIGRNILDAHIKGYQLYPLLSTVIFSLTANAWRLVAGPNAEYFLSIKISVFLFYVLTGILIFRFSNAVNKKGLNKIDFLLIFLSVFSLIVNTQGLSYVDIYIMPPILASLFFLYKKRYFLSGLMMGISVSIKFEPILLIPLFGLTSFDLEKPLKKIIGNSLRFLLGLVPLVVGLWVPLWLYPGGRETMAAQLSVLFKAPYLSGNALNLGWIVTYILHIFRPEFYTSLTLRGGLIYYIGADAIFWPRYLFYLIAILIMLKYWLFQKKNLPNLLTAAMMLYFSHFMINREVHEQHLIYTVVLALILYLVSKSKNNLSFLILVDIMNLVNLILFYGFIGASFFNRLFLGVDITLIFAVYYIIIYLWILGRYFRFGTL